MSEQFVMRPDRYRRKRDGYTVIAADWPDGDVSWMLDPLPVIAFGKAWGTCSAATFARAHEPLPSNDGNQTPI